MRAFNARIAQAASMRRAAGTDRESVWTESVTNPPGIRCYLSAQNRPEKLAAPSRTRTATLLVRSRYRDRVDHSVDRRRPVAFRASLVERDHARLAQFISIGPCFSVGSVPAFEARNEGV